MQKAKGSGRLEFLPAEFVRLVYKDHAKLNAMSKDVADQMLKFAEMSKHIAGDFEKQSIQNLITTNVAGQGLSLWGGGPMGVLITNAAAPLLAISMMSKGSRSMLGNMMKKSGKFAKKVTRGATQYGAEKMYEPDWETMPVTSY